MPIQDRQVTNKEHAVPQNIMEVEFKLIGELTMRQFTYLLVFFGTAYLAKMSVPPPFTWFFVGGIALTGIAFAFIPFADRGLDEWIINFLKAISSPTERIWKKHSEIPPAFAYEQNLHLVQQELITLAPTASRRKLEEYLHQRKEPTKEDKLDIPIATYIAKVKETFKDFVPQIPAKDTKTKPVQVIHEKGKGMSPAPTQVQKRTKMEQIIQARIKKSKLKFFDEGKSTKELKLQPITGHSGRRFVNLTPAQKQIILPVRREKTSEAAWENEKAYSAKSKRLQALLNKGKSEEKPKNKPPKTEAKEQKKTPTVKEIPTMIKKPNIISGVVKNQDGNHLGGVVLIIRNEKGEPVRALKTNKLGEFLISTPLPNGKYEIEVDKTKKTNLSFDIIPLEIVGGLLPSFELIGQ